MNVFPFNQTHYFSRNALRAIDSDAIEKFGIPSIVLMENAAKGAANIILDSTESNGIEKISIILYFFQDTITNDAHCHCSFC